MDETAGRKDLNMERASVTRLYRDSSSQETILLMEEEKSKERIRITIPAHRAGILALEGHGLNDRCALYRILSECVVELGGSFGSVVVTANDDKGVSGSISICRDESIIRWIKADVVELVAFALHTQTPLYLNRTDKLESAGENAGVRETPKTEAPSVFETALAEILMSDMNGGELEDGEVC